ncbi:MAG: dihydrodipicolinate synthase/N-acetylneuraminate lyase [Verrucomicrobiales bacterium]|jgi:dihydrodipicolinate synthase/N-acetylneuraminate lyase
MKTTPITSADLARSIIAVPPLCRDANLKLADSENVRLVKHMENGGVRILLYGGNANLYNIAVSEYPVLLDFLEASVGDDTLIVPSVGPMYGNIMDQAEILRERQFPAAMILPTLFPATTSGVQTALRHFVDRSNVRAVIYIKDENYITPQAVKELVDDGLVSWIKYAVVREDPLKDPYLEELIDKIDSNMIVSGIGEQPAIAHLDHFKVVGFTSGCVCVAPRRSMAMLEALKNEDLETAEELRQGFVALEDLRNGHGPIPVLHHAVALAGIADTGPHLPLLSALDDDLLATIAPTAQALLEWNASYCADR